MSTELPKTYDPSAVESEAYRVWLEEKAFHADPAAPGEPYCIVIPPPNVTGALHLGHAINNTLQDILIRQHRMMGFNTLWVPGIDHAGIATQAVVEKQLKENENKTRHDLGREALVKRIWDWKEQYGNRILEQLKRLGASCDWDRTRFTLDEQCARAVRETFFKLFKDGLIYRGKRLVNWDVFLQTSVSDDEIYHETVKTNLWHIRYPIESSTGFQPVSGGSGHGQDARATYMVVATTRPETMLGDTAVAVHPDDPRWNWAIGKHVKLPLTGRLIPIIADAILVDPKFGTGVVKVTPAHDPNDYAVWQRHKGKSDEIDIINILTPDGKINENGGPYAGLRRDIARKKVVEDLVHQGLLEKEEPYETQVGHSDRSKTPIEPYLSDQWFVKMAPLAEPALEAVREKKVKFTPERYANTFLDWLGEKRDWPISRQLWWGHRIPVWNYNGNQGAEMFAKIAQYADDPDVAGMERFTDWNVNRVFRNADAESVGASYEIEPLFISIRPGRPDLEKAFEAAGFVQDPDVLDTWFSSALWPHSTLGWPEQSAELKKWYPTSTLVTSRDIITLWVARMVMTGLYNMKDIPFDDVYIHPTILDGKGERMSKSKGNGVDPVEIIDTYGADALRFTLTQMSTETQDVRMPVKKLADGRNTSEKFEVGRNFCNKLWNASRFALANLVNTPEQTLTPALSQGERELGLADQWILSRLARTIQDVNAALAGFHFDQYAKLCYDFFWRDLCDWYIEAAKPAMKDPARAAQTASVLAASLDVALRLMHPMIPFITETIWWKLNEVRKDRSITGKIDAPPSDRLIKAAWPKADGSLINDEVEANFSRLQELIAAIRNIRNEYKVDQKKVVNVSISAPGNLIDQINQDKALIQLLAVCQVQKVQGNIPAIANSARATAGGCEVYVEGLVDQAAEQQRSGKRREELEKQIAALKARLANPSYASKAPAHLVKQTQDQLVEAEAELAKLGT